MNSGAYQIYIDINEDIILRIGSLGSFTFLKGKYIYTGSAMKNLEQRIARHLSKNKKLHWHIDFLLMNPNVYIEKIIKFESHKNIECDINLELISKGA